MPFISRPRSLAAVGALLLGLTVAPARPMAAQDDAIVRAVADTIVYDGPLSPDGITRVRALLTSSTRRLRITSTGGDIDLGMDLGEVVADHRLDVEVGAHCFSSCANYVFPAGYRKILSRTSQLGWHGGAFQPMTIDDPDEQRMYDAYIGPVRVRETAFFARIGVDQRSTTYGQGPAFARFAECVGWRYSLEAMATLGMHDVILADGSWQPAASHDGACIFTVATVESRGAPR